MNKMTLKGKTIMEAISFLQEEYPYAEIVKTIQRNGEITISVQSIDYLYDEFYIDINPKTLKINCVDRIKAFDRFYKNYCKIADHLRTHGFCLYKSSQINGYTRPGDVRIENYKGRYGEGVKVIFHYTSRNSICEYWI